MKGINCFTFFLKSPCRENRVEAEERGVVQEFFAMLGSADWRHQSSSDGEPAARRKPPSTLTPHPAPLQWSVEPQWRRPLSRRLLG